jgi:hypothetical protein
MYEGLRELHLSVGAKQGAKWGVGPIRRWGIGDLRTGEQGRWLPGYYAYYA